MWTHDGTHIDLCSATHCCSSTPMQGTEHSVRVVGHWYPMAYLHGIRPPPVSGHSTVVIGDDVFLFGGLLSNSRLCSNELWVYSFARQRWSQPSCTGMLRFPCCSARSSNNQRTAGIKQSLHFALLVRYTTGFGPVMRQASAIIRNHLTGEPLLLPPFRPCWRVHPLFEQCPPRGRGGLGHSGGAGGGGGGLPSFAPKVHGEFFSRHNVVVVSGLGPSA